MTSLLLNALGLLGLPWLLASAPVEADAPFLLTLDAARELALERNTSLQRQANAADLSQVSVDHARAALLPDLRLSASASENFGRAVEPLTGDVDGEHSRSLSLQASSSLNLFSGFGDVAAIESARQSAAASAGDLQRSREAVLYQVTGEYLLAILDLELISIEDERLDAERGQLDRIESLHEVGERPWADVLQQRAAVAGAELDQLTARQRYELDLLTLKDLLGFAAGVAIHLQSPIHLGSPDEAALAPVDGDLQSLLADALQDRADVQAQQARVRAAVASMQVARSGYWPSLDLTVGAGSSYNSQVSAFGFGDQFVDTNPRASVGLSLSLPIFDRQLTDVAVSRSRIQLADAKLVSDATVREVGMQLEQALLNHRIAVARFDVSQTQVQYAGEALAATEARYFEGLATLVEVGQARAQYVEAAGNRATAQTTVTLRRLEIELQRGGSPL